MATDRRNSFARLAQRYSIPKPFPGNDLRAAAAFEQVTVFERKGRYNESILNTRTRPSLHPQARNAPSSLAAIRMTLGPSISSAAAIGRPSLVNVIGASSESSVQNRIRFPKPPTIRNRSSLEKTSELACTDGIFSRAPGPVPGGPAGTIHITVISPLSVCTAMLDPLRLEASHPAGVVNVAADPIRSIPGIHRLTS